MMISTKGRYALRIMVDLAQNKEAGYISLKDVAERQHVSMKYLEMIVGSLNRAGLVSSLRGKNGGYQLAVPMEECTVADVIRATEGSLNPVNCVACEGGYCDQEENCYSFPVWQKLDQVIEDYLKSVSIADLLEKDKKSSISGTGACR